MNVRHEFADSSPTRLPQAAADQNPYASPQIDGAFLIPSATAIGVWRLDDTLVMHKDAILPPICFRTGLPCDPFEARTYWGSSRWVNRTTRAAFIAIAAMTAIALLLFKSAPLKEAAGALGVGIFLVWLTAPFGAKEVRIVYYHSTRSRRRRRHWRIAGLTLAFAGSVSLPITDPAYLPNWLPEFAVAIPILLIFGGGALTLPLLTGFSVNPFQGSYLLLSGCGNDFIARFPECTLDFRQTPGAWIRRFVHLME